MWLEVSAVAVKVQMEGLFLGILFFLSSGILGKPCWMVEQNVGWRKWDSCSLRLWGCHFASSQLSSHFASLASLVSRLSRAPSLTYPLPYQLNLFEHDHLRPDSAPLFH